MNIKGIQPQEFPHQVREAFAALKNYDCEKAWAILWPLFVKRDPVGTSAFVEATYFGLQPPNVLEIAKGDFHKVYNETYLFPVFVFAAEAREDIDLLDEDFRKNYYSILSDVADKATGDSKVIECYKFNSAKDCTNYIMSKNYITKFSEFTETVTIKSRSMFNNRRYPANCYSIK
jgi:hypothetical protein